MVIRHDDRVVYAAGQQAPTKNGSPGLQLGPELGKSGGRTDKIR
jgi:hypothetical protein